MSLASLQTATILYTNRPDLTLLTVQAIKAAVLKFHSNGYFAQDLTVATKTFGVAASYQTINYKTDYPLFRQVAYIKRLPITGPAVPHTYVPPEQFFGSATQKNTFTLDNTNISIASVDSSTQVLIGVYEYPDLTLNAGDSFIADEMPDLIATEAASIIFRSTNQMDKANTFAQIAREMFTAFKQTKSTSISTGK